MGTKTSIIWKIPKKDLEGMIKESNSIRGLIKKFGLSHDSNYKTIKERCDFENIDLSQLKERSRKDGIERITKLSFKQQITTAEILVENSTYGRCELKKRILKEGLLEEKCDLCGLLPSWEGKRLVLVLDHINGTNNDNRLENLRLLCPNCNSQTQTFTGRKNRKKCIDCNTEIYRTSTRCRKCSGKKILEEQKPPSRCPSKDQLIEMKSTMSREAIGRQLGVSGNAVKKWEEKLGLI